MKISYNGKRNTVFLLFSSDHSLVLNSLSNHLKFTFSTNSLSIFVLHFLHSRVIIDCISSFSKQRFKKNIINYFIRKSVNAYAVAVKPLVFTVNFRNLIFTIKILAKFVKPIVTTITIFHASNTNFVRVAIRCLLKLQ